MENTIKDTAVSELLSDDSYYRKDYINRLSSSVRQKEETIRILQDRLTAEQKRLSPLRNLYKTVYWASQPGAKVNPKKKTVSLPGPAFDLTVVSAVVVLGAANAVMAWV